MEPTDSKPIDQWTAQIKQDIADNRVMQIFNQLAVPFEVRNIFADPNIRPAVCAFTNWPTIPQIFIDGEFVGGCDIVTEMYQTGDLQKRLESPAPKA